MNVKDSKLNKREKLDYYEVFACVRKMVFRLSI
jgi:hypothetical protein